MGRQKRFDFISQFRISLVERFVRFQTFEKLASEIFFVPETLRPAHVFSFFSFLINNVGESASLCVDVIGL